MPVTTATPNHRGLPDPAAAARAALIEAAPRQGFDPVGAQLLHSAANQVFRLAGDRVIAKVHGQRTEYADALRQITAAKELLAAGVLTAAPAGRISRPIVSAGGMLVTFTEDLGDRRPSLGQLGEIAARLHRIPPLTHCLKTADKIAVAARRLDGLPPTAITDRDRGRLRRYLEDAAHSYERIARPASCNVHGDLNLTNAVLARNGRAALLDLESTAVSDPVWDQGATGWSRDAFGHDPAEHAAFVAGYGYDITVADGGLRYELATPLFAITSYLFYAEWGRTRAEARAEAERRLETILSRRPFPWGWKPVPPLPSADAAPEPTGR